MQQKNILDYFKSCLTTDYANFNGRARRLEYWGFILFTFLISSATSIIDNAIFDMTESNVRLLSFGTLATLALFIPSMSVAVRRFHDTNRRGWFPILLNTISLSFIALPSVIADLQTYSTTGTTNIWRDPKIIAFVAIAVVVIIGGIITLVVCFTEGTHGTNHYGSDPKNPEFDNEINEIGLE
ncbi:DUF805 domain-containing protein [Bacteroidia bacterium]|jgi:uncharacterized membrane protein YhaH (DUF805 family)|nr:DUF805 domain-containing protein [Bacteroidia bacterium]